MKAEEILKIQSEIDFDELRKQSEKKRLAMIRFYRKERTKIREGHISKINKLVLDIAKNGASGLSLREISQGDTTTIFRITHLDAAYKYTPHTTIEADTDLHKAICYCLHDEDKLIKRYARIKGYEYKTKETNLYSGRLIDAVLAWSVGEESSKALDKMNAINLGNDMCATGFVATPTDYDYSYNRSWWKRFIIDPFWSFVNYWL